MTKLLTVVLILALVAAPAVAAEKSNHETVRVTRDATAVEGCQLLGPVESTATSGAGGQSATAWAERLAWDRLQAEARKAGASVVLLVSWYAADQTAGYRGEAFQCEVAP